MGGVSVADGRSPHGSVSGMQVRTILAVLLSVAAADAQHQEIFPLGPLGGLAKVVEAEVFAELTAVDEGGPLARAGLVVGDRIVAVGGMPFVAHTRRIDDGGTGPQRALGEAVDDAMGSVEEVGAVAVTVTVARDDQALDLHLALPVRPALGAADPGAARRALRSAAAAQLLAAQRDDGGLRSRVGLTGHRVLSAWALLALLAHDDDAQRAARDRLAGWLRGPEGRAWLPADFSQGPDGLDNWALASTAIALAEHALDCDDEEQRKTDLAVLAHCNAGLVARMTDDGLFGHATTAGYDGKGFNVINAQAQLAWSLGAAAGVPIDAEAFARSEAQLAQSLDPDGGVRYWTMKGTGTGDASLRTSAFALSLGLTGRLPEVRAKLLAYLDTHAARAREAHAVGSLGMLLQAPALRAWDRAAYERFLAEWRWYLTLMWCPDDRIAYIGGKGNNGGDDYLDRSLIAAVLALQLLAVDEQHLHLSMGG